MTKLYKPIIKPPAGLGYEGDDRWEETPATYAPYEYSYIQLKEFPDSYFWTWGVWAWLKQCGPEVLDDLHANRWMPWADETIPYHFYAHNQGAQILMVEERTPAFRMREWIRSDDLEHARHYPVALSYKSPQKEFPGWIPPDLAIGSCALVKDGEDSRVYQIEQLGEEARIMQARIQQGLVLYKEKKPEESGWAVWADERRKHHLQRRECWEDVHQAAQRLAELYWQFHILVHPPTPTIFNFFEQGGSVAIPTNIVIKGALAAFSNANSGANEWVEEENGVSYYEYCEGKDTARVQYLPEQLTAGEHGTLLAQIRSLSDLDGDVLLILLAQWCADEQKEEGYSWISNEIIFDCRRIEPRTHVTADGQKHRYQYRYEDAKLIEQSMAHIQSILVTVQQWTKAEQNGKRKRGRPRKEYLALKDRLIEIPRVLTHGLLFDDGANGLRREEVQVAWKFRPGTALAPLLQDASPIFGTILQISLSFNPKKEWWEKRLSRFLLFHMYTGGLQSRTWRIRDIFADQHFPEEGDKPDRIRSHFEKALNRLKEKHPKFPQAAPLLISWSYEEDLTDTLPAKKWLQPWLNCHVHLQISQQMVDGSLIPDKKEEQNEKKGL